MNTTLTLILLLCIYGAYAVSMHSKKIPETKKRYIPLATTGVCLLVILIQHFYNKNASPYGLLLVGGLFVFSFVTSIYRKKND